LSFVVKAIPPKISFALGSLLVAIAVAATKIGFPKKSPIGVILLLFPNFAYFKAFLQVFILSLPNLVFYILLFYLYF